MIKEISVRNIATYNNVGVTLGNLNKINFLYGTNGSGKTTLSNVVKETANFRDCEMKWVAQPLKTLVYNQKFVEENFHQDTNIKGIFTLGKESAEILKAIDEKKGLVNKLTDEIQKLDNILKTKEEEYTANENEFIEDCWVLKRKYDEVFSEAFTGLRNNKINFMKKCKEATTLECELCEFEELRLRSNELFKGNLEKIQLLKTLNTDELITVSSSEVFQKPIVGKQEVEIAKLISKLAISDWVKQGYNHIHLSEGKCPFCQQTLPDAFAQKHEEYFNEVYENEMKDLRNCIDLYMKLYADLEQLLINLLESKNPYLNSNKVMQQYDLIRSKHETNLGLIVQKEKEPSKSVQLELLSEIISSVNEEIENVNKQINRHNNLADNRVREEKLIKEQIWRFLAHENNHNHEKYVRKEFNLKNAINGIKDRKAAKTNDRRNTLLEIESLEAEITSVTPSINEMNRLLHAYKFTNFKFAQTSSQGNYRLVRDNGEDVNQTLSEGEKTFVTFLYFMHLLNGSNNRELITENKIAVIDDPISSLDSNVLFIVSNLILKLIDDIRNNKNNVVQLFVLTHNIYFHKEVTFNRNRRGRKLNDETFWIIRKVNNTTEAKSYDINPIKTSYELMWQELRTAQGSSSSTVQNLIRRIIENYFKLFGNVSEDDILDKFEDEEKIICKSLISWANDGSHFANDDLYVEHPMDIIGRYLEVFEKIFIVTNHHAHYKMMMGVDDEPELVVNQGQAS